MLAWILNAGETALPQVIILAGMKIHQLRAARISPRELTEAWRGHFNPHGLPPPEQHIQGGRVRYFCTSM